MNPSPPQNKYIGNENKSLSSKLQAVSNESEIIQFDFSLKTTELEFILIGCDGIWEGSCDNGKSIMNLIAE